MCSYEAQEARLRLRAAWHRIAILGIVFRGKPFCLSPLSGIWHPNYAGKNEQTTAAWEIWAEQDCPKEFE